MNYYCKHCGTKASSVGSLVSNPCSRHPDGPGKGKHALYEGDEKAKYTCKYCGTTNSSLASLVSNPCQRHPNGPNQGRHSAAL
jgi:hypothetical protein